MVQIKWTSQAKDDLKAIADYIKLDSVRYAKLQIIRIKSRTHILKSHPRAGKVVPELDNEEIREIIESNYRIVYKVVSNSQVDILTIHHSARDMTKRGIG